MFVEANSFREANRRQGDIERIVVHTAEIDEGPLSAERIAAFFSNPTTTVSAHAVIDVDSVVECVKEEDIAFHAAGDNEETLGYELAARASQTAAQWRDGESTRMLRRFARYVAPKCVFHQIPVRWLTPEQEERRARGFVTHKVVSDVFGEGVRSDPGQFFPYKEFLVMVREEIDKLNPDPAPSHLPEWRVVVAGRIEHRETQKAGQRPTAYDRTVTWLGSKDGELVAKGAAKNGKRAELVFKP